jgi:hypothetical protein
MSKAREFSNHPTDPPPPRMLPLNRRQLLQSLSWSTAGILLSQCAIPASDSSTAAVAGTPSTGPVPPTPRTPTPYRGRLPLSTTFIGKDKFNSLCVKAQKENWAAMPLGSRTTTAGRALVGTRYGNYTLEIHDHVEDPSVNLSCLDCWTFYETSLAFARMVRARPAPWTEADLLHFVELERYRGGKCDGNYLSRMHHLEEVFHDNERRGLGQNITRSLGGVKVERNIREMQVAWKSYRYLRNNPSLRSGIARVEARVSDLPVTYIPKSKVAGIESRLQNGDVLAIACADPGGYTSHVGLAMRDGSSCRFMHATSSRDKGRCCIVDRRISSYLAEKRSNMGLIVFRPSDVA